MPNKMVNPGEQSLLIDLARVANKNIPQVLTSASRIYSEGVTPNSYSFIAKSPVKTLNSARVLLPVQPKQIVVTDSKGQVIADVKTTWDTSSNTLYLGFANSPDGIKVNLNW